MKKNFTNLSMNLIKIFLSKIYLALYSLWKLSYYLKILSTKKFNTKIISVGNISVGGTGKTPTIELISRELSKKNIPHCIVSRGYKKQQAGLTVVSNGKKIISSIRESGDEAYMLAKMLKKTPIIVGDKNSAISLAISRFKPELVLVDDGFQSLNISRNYDIVLVDISVSFDNYRLLPLGRLREPLYSLKRANSVIFTKSNHGARDAQKTKQLILKSINESTPVYKSIVNGKIKKFCFETDSFQSNNITIPDFFIGISGLANNHLFKKMVLNQWGSKNIFLSYPDHHNYSNQDIEKIKQGLKTHASSVIITTRKDFYKIYKKLKQYDLFILDVEHKIDDISSLIDRLYEHI